MTNPKWMTIAEAKAAPFGGLSRVLETHVHRGVRGKFLVIERGTRPRSEDGADILIDAGAIISGHTTREDADKAARTLRASAARRNHGVLYTVIAYGDVPRESTNEPYGTTSGEGAA